MFSTWNRFVQSEQESRVVDAHRKLIAEERKEHQEELKRVEAKANADAKQKYEAEASQARQKYEAEAAQVQRKFEAELQQVRQRFEAEASQARQKQEAERRALEANVESRLSEISLLRGSLEEKVSLIESTEADRRLLQGVCFL
jgi:hypothetical protein